MFYQYYYNNDIVADNVPRASRIGRQRDDHPAGHRPRRRGASLGVRVHGRRHGAGAQDGRIRDGSRGAGHRAPVGPTPASGNVDGPAAAATPLRPGRQRLRTPPRPIAGRQQSTEAAAQDHGHSDALAVGPKLAATMRRSQILGSQARHPGPYRGSGPRNRGIDVDHDPS